MKPLEEFVRQRLPDILRKIERDDISKEKTITSTFGRLLFCLFSSLKTVIYLDKLPFSRRKLSKK